jgi:predicted dinucleotide-binding enzyme
MSRKRHFAIAAVLLGSVLALPAQAETIALIGTGGVSSALGPRLAGLGHRIVYGSRSPEDAEVQALVKATGDDASAAVPSAAAEQADIVIVAVPWAVAEQVVLGLGDLSGKIIVDPINPRVIAADGLRDYASYTSSAERLQKIAPGAFVVKAFNTISVDSMQDPDLLGFPLTVPIVGNDAAAKATIAGIVEQLGYEVVDLGPVRYAHIIEGLYLLRTNARDVLGTHFEYQLHKREVPLPQTVY